MATEIAMMRCPGCGAKITTTVIVPMDTDPCDGCVAGLALCIDVTAGGTRKYHMTQSGVSVPHKE